MKKNGMTLPEIMITVVIIGIISAIILPMANHAKPNETKIAFLKNYDELTNAVHELVNNSRLYPICQTQLFSTYCFENYPLLNDEAIRNDNNTIRFAGGIGKLCRLLAFQYDAENPICSDVSLPAAPTTPRDNNFSFTTKTGAEYRVLTKSTLAPANYLSEILIDVNGNGNGNDCTYDATTCTDPDTFRFWVTADGNILSGDVAGDAYLNTRNNPKSKSLIIEDNDEMPVPTGIVPDSQITVTSNLPQINLNH